MATNGFGFVPLVPNAEAVEVLATEANTPEELMGGGEHFQDVHLQYHRREQDDCQRTRLRIHVENTFLTRPKRRGQNR